MKICPRCKQDKELVNYYQNPKTLRYDSFCRPCKLEYGREHRILHKEQYKKYWSKWRKKNPIDQREYLKNWRKNNPEKYQKSCRNWADKNRLVYEANRREKVRQEVFATYGGYICACCKETEKSFLTIDHVNNDGNKHRKELHTKIGKGGTAFFDWLRSNKFPEGFQVLCRNCNWGKHINKGICPHKSR